MQYPIVIEMTNDPEPACSAFAPDFDGVIATGDTLEECAALMTEALAFHIEGMKAAGLPLPGNDRVVRMVELAVA